MDRWAEWHRVDRTARAGENTSTRHSLLTTTDVAVRASPLQTFGDEEPAAVVTGRRGPPMAHAPWPPSLRQSAPAVRSRQPALAAFLVAASARWLGARGSGRSQCHLPLKAPTERVKFKKRSKFKMEAEIWVPVKGGGRRSQRRARRCQA